MPPLYPKLLQNTWASLESHRKLHTPPVLPSYTILTRPVALFGPPTNE